MILRGSCFTTVIPAVIDPQFTWLFIDSAVGRLRSRVSHTFLDHEILLVSTQDAVIRWNAGEWTCRGNRLELAFRSYELDALSLGDRILEFSPAALIDQLQSFSLASDESRSVLRRSLAAWYHARFEVGDIRARYLNTLQPLLNELDWFRATVNDAGSVAGDVERRWADVLSKARELKQFFDSEAMPKATLLPLDFP